jgi:hypothetical protein
MSAYIENAIVTAPTVSVTAVFNSEKTSGAVANLGGTGGGGGSINMYSLKVNCAVAVADV